MFQSSYPEVNISNNSHNTHDGGSLKEVLLQVLLMEMFFRTAFLMKAHILWKGWCDRDLHLYLQNKNKNYSVNWLQRHYFETNI